MIGLLPFDWRLLVGTAAGTALLGALLSALLLRPGPHLPRAAVRPRPRAALEMFRVRRQRLVNIGYLGHMWELYAMWAWFATFLLAAQGSQVGDVGPAVGIAVFGAIGVGGSPAAWSGVVSPTASGGRGPPRPRCGSAGRAACSRRSRSSPRSR
ncbi:hypothetical protein GCM10025865_17250 [Paraoerskovia sediminicola]|uniref:Uncharacterized protein n=1 Tax=Paraoerskovia sediminicola TaxID=1138587 RepID=A0ABN6XC66_9CELL|nr:hypothetical protein GCM10025865_17250 [Paraoerskovia sediminicola]